MEKKTESARDHSQHPEVTPFFDEDSNTFSYVVRDPGSSSCAIIDSVVEFDYPSGRIRHQGANRIIDYIKQQQLTLEWQIETHVHADHMSAAPYIQLELGGKIAIGADITRVQQTFAEVFNEPGGFPRDGSQFDHLFHDGEEYKVGKLECIALHTPGHTPACMTHVLGDAVFVGDTLFMPDAGTARADFPGGDASELFHSIQRILALPDAARVFVCHDYLPGGRAAECQSSIAAQRRENIHVNEGVNESEFVAMREKRDKTLGMPRLILPSLQVNMRAGHLPDPETNGTNYLKIPLNRFE